MVYLNVTAYYIRLTAFFPGQLVRTGTRVAEPFSILMKQEMIWWQWHQLDHMRIIYKFLRTDNHASIPYHSVFTGQMPFLSPNQQRQSTEGSSEHLNVKK